jgi:hypothetical protein
MRAPVLFPEEQILSVSILAVVSIACARFLFTVLSAAVLLFSPWLVVSRVQESAIFLVVLPVGFFYHQLSPCFVPRFSLGAESAGKCFGFATPAEDFPEVVISPTAAEYSRLPRFPFPAAQATLFFLFAASVGASVARRFDFPSVAEVFLYSKLGSRVRQGVARFSVSCAGSVVGVRPCAICSSRWLWFPQFSGFVDHYSCQSSTRSAPPSSAGCSVLSAHQSFGIYLAWVMCESL